MRKYVAPFIRTVSLKAAGNRLLFSSGKTGTIDSGNSMDIDFIKDNDEEKDLPEAYM